MRLKGPCPACGGGLEPQHCGACHALFAQCAACDARWAPWSASVTPVPGSEHPRCLRCDSGERVRPATRSDFEVRGWLDWVAD